MSIIAKIDLDKEQLMERSLAILLGLSFEEINYDTYHVGCVNGVPGIYTKPYHQRVETLELRENDEYYNTKGERVQGYYIVKPLPAYLENKDLVYVPKEGHLVDLLIFSEHAGNLKYYIVRTVKQQLGDLDSQVLALLHTVEDKLNTLRSLVGTEEYTFNSRCDVHVGGGLIATYNEVLLMEDCCTDDLQVSLDQGWRMIACCVQPQRRPDYILGRFNPTRDAGSYACRAP